MRHSRLPRFQLALALSLLLILIGRPAALHAHAHLERSEPAAGSTVAAAPSELRLWFSEAPELALSHVALVGPDGISRALTGLQPLAGQRGAVRVALPVGLAPGRYTVNWRVVSEDGHPSKGSFAFTIAAAKAAPAAPAASAQVTPDTVTTAAPAATPASNAGTTAKRAGDPVQRWAEFVALLTVLGALALEWLLLTPMARRGAQTMEMADGARRLGIGASVLLVACLIARLFTERSTIAALAPAGAAPTVAQLLQTQWGYGWMLDVIAAVVALGGFVIARRARGGWRLALFAAVGLVLAPALTGHAIADRDHPLLAVLFDALHLTSAGVWLGGLLALVLVALPLTADRQPDHPAGTRPTTAALVHRYHPVALTGATLVVLSGVGSAWLRLGAFGALTGTEYGKTLLWKLGLFVVVAIIGAFHWRTLGEVDAGQSRRFRRTATLELVFAGLVLAATAVLVGTPTP